MPLGSEALDTSYHILPNRATHSPRSCTHTQTPSLSETTYGADRLIGWPYARKKMETTFVPPLESFGFATPIPFIPASPWLFLPGIQWYRKKNSTNKSKATR
jgi:hypothetical protein